MSALLRIYSVDSHIAPKRRVRFQAPYSFFPEALERIGAIPRRNPAPGIHLRKPCKASGKNNPLIIKVPEVVVRAAGIQSIIRRSGACPKGRVHRSPPKAINPELIPIMPVNLAILVQ
jgi:hypothetical protein